MAALVVALPSAPVRRHNAACLDPDHSRTDPEATDKIALDVQTSLNFDQLVVDGGGAGSALIRPDELDPERGRRCRHRPAPNGRNCFFTANPTG